MKRLLREWKRFLGEAFYADEKPPNPAMPSASSQYLHSHPALEQLRQAVRDRKDMIQVRSAIVDDPDSGIDSDEFYRLMSVVSNEPEFEDDNDLLDFVVSSFRPINVS